MSRDDYDRPARGSFGSAFGTSMGCIFGAAAALLILCVLPPVLIFGFGIGCAATDRVREAARRVEEAKQAEAKAAANAVGPGEWGQVGDTRVRVDKVAVKKPRLKFVTAAGEHEGAEEELHIWLTIENRSPTKKLEYLRWAEADFLDDRGQAVDEHGNAYRMYTRERMVEGLKQTTATINPGDPPIQDLVTFQKPVPAAKTLWLTLDAQAAGEKGKFHFRIPAAAWAK